FGRANLLASPLFTFVREKAAAMSPALYAWTALLMVLPSGICRAHTNSIKSALTGGFG
uniref:Uncharacterized protein n=1 Tax=Aegilops tauschii subsp. strangulata TaxID=200361 RepID=A0A453FDZ7_AEGTS